MATGEAGGGFYGEAISAVAGAVANMAVDQLTDKAVSKGSEAALKHISGDDAAE